MKNLLILVHIRGLKISYVFLRELPGKILTLISYNF